MISVSWSRTRTRFEEFLFLRELSQVAKDLKAGGKSDARAHELTHQLASKFIGRLGGGRHTKIVVNTLAMLLCCGLPLAYETAMQSLFDPSFMRSQKGLLFADAFFSALLTTYVISARHEAQHPS
jgi:hypothetical protein